MRLNFPRHHRLYQAFSAVPMRQQRRPNESLKSFGNGNADLTPRIALETEESVVLSAPNGHWRNHWMESPNGRTSEDTLTPDGGAVPCE